MNSPDDNQGLFDQNRERFLEQHGPLAARMRPRSLDDFVGQEKVIGEGSVIRRMLERGQLSSMIFWGPPGVGKTTLARLLSRSIDADFSQLSAVSSGVADLRREVAAARERLGMQGRRTILFIDEIHRFNKAQQDAILPHVEDGSVILIGATTENPSFEVNAPLLSRARVIVLESLSDDDIREILLQALNDTERGLGNLRLKISDEALDTLVNLSNGDARFALNTLEMTSQAVPMAGEIDLDTVAASVHRRAAVYDKSGDGHFDTISALHKSIRDSDPDAALYWLARMLDSGDEPLYIARRLVRMASEDIGLAAPNALAITMSAQQAVHFIGMPEGALALAEATVYLALAPKSNAVYQAFAAAREDVESTRNEPVPLHLRNAVTGLMRGLGYGEGYQYAHDDPDAITDQVNLPENLAGKRYYHPTAHGHEATLQKRMEEIARQREIRRKQRRNE